MPVLRFVLRLLLKVFAASVILALALFVWLCSGVLYLSATILGLLSTGIFLLGFIVLITDSIKNGIILLIIAFLVSPIGLPMAAVWLLGKVQSLKYFLQDHMYG